MHNTSSTEPGPLRNVPAQIPTQQTPVGDQRIVFSFKYLHLTNQKLHLGLCGQDFLQGLVQALQRYSEHTLEAFTDQNNKEARHVVWFPETSEPDGFAHLPDQDQLGYHEAWQFAVQVGSPWRVHGILIDNVFHVVWLDPEHKLYPIAANSATVQT